MRLNELFEISLNEGVIKYPPTAYKRMENYLSIVLMSSFYEILTEYTNNADEVFEYLKKKAPSLPYDLAMRQFAVTDKNNNEKTVNIKYSTEELPYIKEKGISIVYANFIFDKTKSYHGSYIPALETVVINISELDFFREIFDIVFPSKNEDIDSLQFTFSATSLPDMIVRHYNKIFDGISATIKHELIHHVQYKYLSYKHKHSRTEEEYYDSEIEFSPQINDFINNFNNLIKQVDENILDTKEGKNSLKKIFYTVVNFSDSEAGENAFVDKMTKAYEDLEIEHIFPKDDFAAQLKFFRILKERNYDNWKKAVRYSYSEIFN